MMRSSCSATSRSRTGASARRGRLTGGIVADRPDDPYILVHPDPSVDLARVAAKKLLCRAAAGENPPGPADLNELPRGIPALRKTGGPERRVFRHPDRGARHRIDLARARARQPLADLRRVVPAHEDCAGADRRGLDAVAGRPREGLGHPHAEFQSPYAYGPGAVPAASERLLAFHPDRPGRPGDRL